MENAFPDYQRYMQLWLEFASKMAAGGTAASGEAVPMDAARSMRESYLRALSEYTEEFMRSPQFMEMMKQSTNTAIDMRTRANDMMTQMQHAAGGVARSDLDSLLNAVRRSETRILEKLDELAVRIGKLETTTPPESNGTPRSKRKASRN